MTFQNLPFREIWAIDAEFHAPDGHRPKPICLAGRELNSGRAVNLWLWEQDPPDPPFDIADDALFVAYHTPAEWSVFLELGWTLPRYSIDLCVEYKLISNRFKGDREDKPKRGLIEALEYFHLPRLTKEAKSGYQDIAIRGGPFTARERRDLQTYCLNDVDVLPPLLECTLRRLRMRRKGISQAIQRGRECRPIAAMEHRGIPMDIDLTRRLKTHWVAIRAELVRRLDQRYGVYDGTTLKQDRLRRYAHEHKIDWPQTATGKLETKDKTLDELVARYPELRDFKKLHYLMTKLKMAKIPVDEHGRNRAMLGPFSAATGRNLPKAGQFVLAQAKWLRPLVKPPEGWGICGADWISQEIVIAAALSGDDAMLNLALTKDPYIAFGQQIGLIEDPDATKASHPAERKMAKECLLGSGIGVRDGQGNAGQPRQGIPRGGRRTALAPNRRIPQVHQLEPQRRRLRHPTRIHPHPSRLASSGGRRHPRDQPEKFPDSDRRRPNVAFGVQPCLRARGGSHRPVTRFDHDSSAGW